MLCVTQRLEKGKLCADAGLLDPNMLGRCLQYYGSVAQFLVKLASGQPADQPGLLSLPLPEAVPMLWSSLPDFYLEDIADLLLFTVQVCWLTGL